MKVVCVAGEASGDALGGDLLSRLSQLNPNVQLFGIGGEHMKQAGLNSWFNLDELSVMGLIEPLKRLPRLLRIRREIRHRVLEMKPDVFIGIDAPDFNLSLEQSIKAAGIRTVHYVSPSVWAWRKRRIVTIQKAVDLMLTLFPFEVDFYQGHHVQALCVGHPMSRDIPLEHHLSDAKIQLGLSSCDRHIALLPGSRNQELRHLLPCFLKAAKQYWRVQPSIHFITAQIHAKQEQQFQDALQEHAPELPVSFFRGRAREVLAASDAAWIASGTATLEAMLCKTPMVIAYRMGYWTHRVLSYFVSLPFYGLPNILAGKEVVPEFIQDQATPEHLLHAMMRTMLPEEQSKQRACFYDMHRQLLDHAQQSAGDAVHQFLLQGQ